MERSRVEGSYEPEAVAQGLLDRVGDERPEELLKAQKQVWRAIDLGRSLNVAKLREDILDQVDVQGFLGTGVLEEDSPTGSRGR